MDDAAWLRKVDDSMHINVAEFCIDQGRSVLGIVVRDPDSAKVFVDFCQLGKSVDDGVRYRFGT